MSKRLQDYMSMVEQDTNHAHGTYAELLPSVKSLRVIEKIIHDLQITNPTPSNEIHCTVTYSRQPCPALAEMQPKMPAGASVSGFDVFPLQKGGYCLVLKLASPQIESLHQQAIELGCSHDYPEYHPHVTLTYNWSSDHLPEMTVKGINLTFDRWNVKPLDPTYIPGE